MANGIQTPAFGPMPKESSGMWDALGFIAPLAMAAVTGGALAPVLTGALTTAGAAAPTVFGSTALGAGAVSGGAIGAGAAAQKLTASAFEEDPQAPAKQPVRMDAASTAQHILGGMPAPAAPNQQQIAARATERYNTADRLRALIR